MALARCEESILWILWGDFLDTLHIFYDFCSFSFLCGLVFLDYDAFSMTLTSSFCAPFFVSVILMYIFSVYALFLCIYICSLVPWVFWVIMLSTMLFCCPWNTFTIIRVYIQIYGLENTVIIFMQYVPFSECLPLLLCLAFVPEHPAMLKTALHNLTWWGPAPSMVNFSSSWKCAWKPDFACWDGWFPDCTHSLASFFLVSWDVLERDDRLVCLRFIDRFLNFWR